MTKGRIQPNKQGLVVFSVTSGFGQNTQEPFVQVEVGNQETQMSPEAARALALNLLQAAEAAESDAAIVAFCKKAQFDEAHTIAMLRGFRFVRDRRHGESPNAA